MSRRVFLHVGTPKSGTTYLQAVLWQNAEALKSKGLLLPGRFQVHYAAAKGVTSRRGMRRRVAVDMDRAWSRLARQTNHWADDALISHELFAPATAVQASSARETLDGEIHLILTARALHRQLPASWQEQVKGGLATPYEEFLSRVRSGSAKGAWFWEVQDLIDIADRWAADIPAARVHIVTVPRDSADSSLLWSRYCTVLGLEPSEYDITVRRKNVSLGVVEAELLRRLHARRDYRFTDPDRHPWTRKLLAAEILGQRRSSPIATPAEAQPWLQQRSAATVESVASRRYDVVGTLDDLRWEVSPPAARELSSVTEEEIAEAAAWTVGRLRSVLEAQRPRVSPPELGDGLEAILELLEAIRAAETGQLPRPAAAQRRLTDSSLKIAVSYLKRP